MCESKYYAIVSVTVDLCQRKIARPNEPLLCVKMHAHATYNSLEPCRRYVLFYYEFKRIDLKYCNVYTSFNILKKKNGNSTAFHRVHVCTKVKIGDKKIKIYTLKNKIFCQFYYVRKYNKFVISVAQH